MENVVSINHTKENVLEFDISIQGIADKDISVCFVIKTNDMNLSFDASKKGKGDKWSVKLPKLPMLQKTAYKCVITVVADGYYFEPLNGTLNVVGSAEIYSSSPKNVTLEPSKSAEEIARELLEGENYSKTAIEEKIAEHKSNDITHDKVVAILEEFGIKSKSKTRPKISFVKTKTLN